MKKFIEIVENKLDGHKTKIAGALALVTGVYGYVTGTIDNQTAWMFVLAGLSIFGFRDALEKM